MCRKTLHEFEKTLQFYDCCVIRISMSGALEVCLEGQCMGLRITCLEYGPIWVTKKQTYRGCEQGLTG